jgi:hypothetical protein
MTLTVGDFNLTGGGYESNSGKDMSLTVGRI